MCTLKHVRPLQGRAEVETTIEHVQCSRGSDEVGSPGGFRLSCLTWLEISLISQTAELTLD